VTRPEDGRFVIQLSLPACAPALHDRTHANTPPVNESEVSRSQSRQTPAQRPVPQQDRMATISPAQIYPRDTTSISASNYGPPETRIQSSGLRSPSDLPMFPLPLPLPLSASGSPQKTAAAAALALPRVGVSQHSRRQMDQTASSHMRFSQHPPETPATGWMPSISQTSNAATSGAATPIVDTLGYYSQREGSGSGLYEIELGSDEGRLLFGGSASFGGGFDGVAVAGDDFGSVLDWSHVDGGTVRTAYAAAPAAVCIDGDVYPPQLQANSLVPPNSNSKDHVDGGGGAPGTLAVPSPLSERGSLVFPTALDVPDAVGSGIQQTESRSGYLDEGSSVPTSTESISEFVGVGVVNPPASSSNDDDVSQSGASELPRLLSEFDAWFATFGHPRDDENPTTQACGDMNDIWIKQFYPEFFDFSETTDL